MCAAPTTPVIPLKVIRHLIVRPVTVAVKVPEPRAPLGVGIDWFTVMNAVSFVFADRTGEAGEATAVATTTVAHIPTTTYIALFILCITLRCISMRMKRLRLSVGGSQILRNRFG